MEVHEQDNLKNKLCALREGGEKANEAALPGKEAAETPQLISDSFLSAEEDKLFGELEKEGGLVSSLQEMKQSADSKQSLDLRDDNQLETLQVFQCNKWVALTAQ